MELNGRVKNKEKPLQSERLDNIRNILLQNKTAKVSYLSKKLEVSENTIRRDFNYIGKISFVQTR